MLLGAGWQNANQPPVSKWISRVDKLALSSIIFNIARIRITIFQRKSLVFT